MIQFSLGKSLVRGIPVVAVILFIAITAEAGVPYPVQPAQDPVFAQVAPGPWYPYGAPPPGMYGQRRAVLTWEVAVQLIREYFPDQHVKVILIQERPWYFIADILDRQQRFIDRVIIDKRTGRIRSIY